MGQLTGLMNVDTLMSLLTGAGSDCPEYYSNKFDDDSMPAWMTAGVNTPLLIALLWNRRSVVSGESYPTTHHGC